MDALVTVTTVVIGALILGLFATLVISILECIYEEFFR